jgi:hypothetical protein
MNQGAEKDSCCAYVQLYRPGSLFPRRDALIGIGISIAKSIVFSK